MRKKNIIFILSVCCLAVVALLAALIRHSAAAEAGTVYVSSEGADTNTGTSIAPFQTFEKAMEEVVDGGTVVLCDTVAIDGWESHGKCVSVTGGALDARSSTDVVFFDGVYLYDTTVLVEGATNVYANGNRVTVGNNVEWSGATTVELHGGGMQGTTVASTDLTVLSGTYKSIFGGSKGGTVLGDTNLYVGGEVNADIDETNHAIDHFVFGGGNGDSINGSSRLTFGGNAKAVYVFGGSNNAGAKIAKNSYVSMLGGRVMSVYGGNRNVDAGNDVVVQISGATLEQVFGGNERAPMAGDVDLRVSGGTITRRLYGGCYNDTQGLSFSSAYCVSGEICLTLGGGATIDFSSQENDRSIYARSRYGEDLETTQIVFSDESAREKFAGKFGAQDTAMKVFMGSLSAADELHLYAYSADGNAITQTCAYHDGFSASATLQLADGVTLLYQGEPLQPANVVYGGAWEYDLPVLSYVGNTRGGVASCSLAAGTASVEKSFFVIETPTLLGASVRVGDPSGLRFQSKVAGGMKEAGASFGTLVIPRAELGDNELTVDTPKVKDIPQTKWATDAVKESMPALYQDGYEYFHAVLTDIPERFYGASIVARSYVIYNDTYYYADEMERSIAQVASLALREGHKHARLYDYVDKALANETLGMEKEVILAERYSYVLKISGVGNCVAVWTVADESVVCVSQSGVITALKAGESSVTATVGSRVLTCKIIVRYDILDGSDELPKTPYLE